MAPWTRFWSATNKSLSSSGGLCDAIFEYLEIFHNRQRRHSALGMLTPIEYEMLYPNVQSA
ncbi:IS3 family transposase [Streptosporangium sp. OZ121]|uniref:IS3 family transposase n=1 Tax=Streptosporangium sp. OZ121 TaxID=3444183 RepID=UPI003F79402C